MSLMQHPTGGYQFLPGIAPYSGGVVSTPGFEIVHVTLSTPLRLRDGFDRVIDVLSAVRRPMTALCAMELRSPRPFTFSGFSQFNAGYASVLDGWDLFVEGINPVARTNVAPVVRPPIEPMLYAFSYTRPCPEGLPPTFVVAGGGELPEGILTAEGIIARGDLSPEGIATKARFVMELMENRLHGLGVDWSDVLVADVYTEHPVAPLLPEVILGRMGRAAAHGIHWHYSRPPIEEIEFEMDLRGTRTELWL